MRKAAEELKHSLHCLVIQNPSVAPDLVGEEKDITPLPALMPALGTLAVGKEWHKVFHTAESRTFPETEKRLGLDLMVILKEW